MRYLPMLFIALCATAYAQESETTEELRREVRELRRMVEDLRSELRTVRDGAGPQASSAVPPGETGRTSAEPAAQDAKRSADPRALGVRWDSGLRFTSENKDFNVKFGGRLNNDWYTGDMDGADFPSGTRFRRARLRLNGTVFEDAIFDWQYEFAGGSGGGFRNMMVGYTGWDAADIQVGQFKEPFALEFMTCADHMTFMERSPLDTLAPHRATGLLFGKEILDGRMIWAAGLYIPSDDFGDGEENDQTGGDWDAAARVTGVPWREDGGSKLLHLGLAFNHREWGGDPFRLRARGAFARGDFLVDTGHFAADAADTAGFEAALVLDAFSLQGEYARMFTDTPLGGGDEYPAWYVQASYFLTGEHRPYKGGKFAQIKPLRPFGRDGGPGAWEFALRYGGLDLTATPVPGAPGGMLHDISAGLNWYLNENLRAMINYIHAETENRLPADRTANIYQARFELSF